MRFRFDGSSCVGIEETAIEKKKKEREKHRKKIYNPSAMKNYFVLLVHGNLCERIKSARRIRAQRLRRGGGNRRRVVAQRGTEIKTVTMPGYYRQIKPPFICTSAV